MAKPASTLKANGVSMSVWASQREGQPPAYSIQRAYKDKDSGDFKYTNFLQPRDLMTVIFLCQKALEDFYFGKKAPAKQQHEEQPPSDNDIPF